MKNGSFIFFIPLILGIVFSIGGLFWWRTAISPPSDSSEEVRVVIERGMSSEKIGERLSKAGVIRNPFAFKLYAQLNDESKSIPPGEFLIPQNLSLKDVISFLKEGPKEYWVTIPEGLRREEYPQRFIDAFGLKGDEAKEFKAKFLSASRNLEGYLFPDSYLFPPDVEPSTIVERLTDTFYNKVGSDFEEKALQVGLSLEEVVVLASLLERETITDEERPIVSGIIFNRLQLGMPLQIDASVQYDLGTKRCRADNGDCEWWIPPLKSDLQIESEYNTYTNQGLPPRPIANPGKDSLMAAVNPEETDYLYYIHADGQIYYAETLEEHNSNVNSYLR